MHTTPVPTADLADQYGDRLRVCSLQFTGYGAVRSFAGPVRTVSCREDNALLHELLHMPGGGAVVVVDGGGSLATTLFGDRMATRARDNGWAGVIVHGAVRDSASLSATRLGVQALGTNPRRAGKAGRGEVDVPVTFGGVSFGVGDILHADEDGVVLLPVDHLS
ncbi:MULTISPECIES: ribonuclease E activity regulator RraA [unclassified Streptomyces]|uniref:ribonuclease E activity regulator RraA n=1 Tax=Streptomyces sp. SID5789 TaxID=2690310 RepID=UPI00136B2BD1|nr:ribonuclease E activity regulator RraA [Streptomyces sp. SID5789]MDV6288019.1 ribonuclease E activity regulator RraA [Streptomyces sp. UP1A-1]MZE67553.1 ribonuclease E activity regulator RraA [Streptomyces sp. SID5789]